MNVTDLPVSLKAYDTFCTLSSTDFIRVDVSLILFQIAWNASFFSNISMASCFNKRLLFRSSSWCCKSWWTCSFRFTFLSSRAAILSSYCSFFVFKLFISDVILLRLFNNNSTLLLWSMESIAKFWIFCTIESRTRLSWFRTSLRTFETRRDVVSENCSGVFDVENDIFSLP